jgi:hypothetical protein
MPRPSPRPYVPCGAYTHRSGSDARDAAQRLSQNGQRWRAVPGTRLVWSGGGNGQYVSEQGYALERVE